MDEKAFEFTLEGTPEISFTLEADQASPIMNPCFVFYRSTLKEPTVTVNDKVLISGQDVRTGLSYDTDGKPKTIVWMEYESEERTDVSIIF
jgi:hypothetical protein